MEVDTHTILFTHDHLTAYFKRSHETERIDDAVDSLLEGKLKVSDIPRLRVVKHEGRLWSLDNWHLWIFKKARVLRITVDLVPYNYRPYFAELMENKPVLKIKLEQRGFWPIVRGKCREKFQERGGHQALQPMLQQARVEKYRAEPPAEKKRVTPHVEKKWVQPAFEQKRYQPPVEQKRVELTVEQKRLERTVEKQRVEYAVEKTVVEVIVEKKRVQRTVEKKLFELTAEKKLVELSVEKKRVDLSAEKKRVDLFVQKKGVRSPLEKKQV